MQKLYFLLFILLLLLPSFSNAQTNPNEYEETPPVLIRNEVSFGLSLHSGGWGLDFRRGKNLTVSKKRMLEFEFVGMHHPKEIKSINPYLANSKSFYYGKLNSVSILRGAIGYQRVIAAKAEKSGVEIRLNYTGGISLGLAKPIYLNIITENFDLITEKFDPNKHALSDIYGQASFTEGLDETKVYPGLYAKLGLSFEYGSQEDDVKIIEAGVTFDAYANTIPIMALTHNNQVYFNFYINLLYGRKW